MWRPKWPTVSKCVKAAFGALLVLFIASSSACGDCKNTETVVELERHAAGGDCSSAYQLGRVVPHVAMRLLRNATDSSIRRTLLEGLVASRFSKPDGYIQLLDELLDHEDIETTHAALRALAVAGYQHTTALVAVTRVAESETYSISFRIRAIEWLARHGKRASSFHPKPEVIFSTKHPYIVRAYAKLVRWSVIDHLTLGSAFAEWLSRNPTSGANPTSLFFEHLPDNSNSRLVELALDYLSRGHPVDVVAALYFARRSRVLRRKAKRQIELKMDGGDALALAAAEASADFDRPRALKFLKDVVRVDKQLPPGYVVDAIGQLTRLLEPSELAEFLETVTSPSPWVRIRIAVALANAGSTPASSAINALVGEILKPAPRRTPFNASQAGLVLECLALTNLQSTDLVPLIKLRCKVDPYVREAITELVIDVAHR